MMQLAEHRITPTEPQRARIDQFARDFPRAWNHADAPVTLRKRLLRGALREAIVAYDTETRQLAVTLHWQCGVHTRLYVDKPVRSIGSRAEPALVDTVRDLATSLDDAAIARVLNMKKIGTPRGLLWTKDRVTAFRKQHGIRPEPRRYDPDLLTGQQAARHLQISRNGLTPLIRPGYLRKDQVTNFAPWRISRADLDSDRVRSAVRILKATGRLPAEGGCPDGQVALFPGSTEGGDKGAL
jgi:hypothetical protein